MRLIDLTYFSCRWPMGDPLSPDFHFCGKAKGFGSPYCPEHHQLAYRPQPQRTPAEATAAHVQRLQRLRITDKERKKG